MNLQLRTQTHRTMKGEHVIAFAGIIALMILAIIIAADSSGVINFFG